MKRIKAIMILLWMLSPNMLSAQIVFTPESNFVSNQETVKPRYHFSFLLKQENDEEIRDFSIEISPFMGPDSLEIPVNWTLNGEAVEGKQALALQQIQSIVTLRANLARIGSYTSVITWRSKDITDRKLLRVERKKRRPSYEILGLGTSTTNSLEFSIHDTSGYDSFIHPPTITELFKEEKDQTKLGASFSSIQVTDEKGNRIDSSILIPSGGYKGITIEIMGLNSFYNSGKYAGTISVSAPDAKESRHSFVLLIRSHCLIAILAIGLGLGAYFCISWILNKEGPNLNQKRNLNLLAIRLQEVHRRLLLFPASDSVNRIVAALDLEWRGLNENLGNIKKKDFDTQFEILEHKIKLLPNWANLLRRIHELEPPSLWSNLLKDLESVERYLESISIEEKNGEIETNLANIEKRINSKLAKELNHQILKIEQGYNELLRLTSNNLADEKINGMLDKAKQEVAVLSFIEAQRLIKDTFKEYRNLAKEILLKNLVNTPPIGLEQAEWDELKTDIRIQLDSNEAFENVYKTYYTKLIQGLKKYVETDLKKEIRQFVPKNTQERAAKKTINKTLSTSLKTLSTSQDVNEELSKAKETYKQQKEIITNLSKIEHLPNSILQLIGSSTNKSFDLKVVPIVDPLEYVRDSSANQLVTANINWGNIQEIDKRRKLLNCWVKVAFAVISILLGLQFLWLDNPTWGGVKDFIIAFLWGLGLNAFGGSAFKFSNLEEQFIKSSST